MPNEMAPSQPFDNEFGDARLFEFTDVAIALPPGIPCRGRSAVHNRPAPSPDAVERQWLMFRQNSDRDLLELWLGHADNKLLRDAVLAEANRRAAFAANGATSEELNQILRS